MKKAFVLTVYNRPDYLRSALDSLYEVRGWEDWHVVFSIEPSERFTEVLDLIQQAAMRLGEKTTIEILINPERYGVLHHPWVVFDKLFGDGFDYVVRSEDDLIHGQDVLEYHSWAAEQFEEDSAVGIVTAFSSDHLSPSDVVRKIGLGSPLLIGTWKHVWSDVLRDTWDHDYSTGSTPDTRGWDHNIHLRIFPSLGLHAILPLHTKVEHIGIYGEHSTPEIFWVQEPFDPVIPKQTYREVTL